MRFAASNLSSRWLLICFRLRLKSSISPSIGIKTLNAVLSPSMRHQRVYVDDILDGSGKCERGNVGGVVVEGPLKMLDGVGVRSTEPYTIYGSEVGYRLRSVHPFHRRFVIEVGVRSPPPRAPSARSVQ
jgi:hypothetical protein